MATKRLLLGCVVLMAWGGSGTALWSQTAGFAYVANSGPNNISAYSINGSTGALTPVFGSPFLAGSFPFSLTTTAGPAPPPVPAAKE